MRPAACVLLILCLATLPPAALLVHDVVAADGQETALSHLAQPLLVRAQASTKFDLRLCAVRADACQPPDLHFGLLAGSRSGPADACLPCTRPDGILRI